MALSANTVWEVRAAGAITNGGGFVTGASGTDFSQQDNAQYSGTNLASANGTTNPSVVTSATHNFVAADVGNLIHVTAGTNWTAGFYQIVSVAGNAATLDRAVGTAAGLSGGTFAVGGAINLANSAAEAQIYAATVAGNVVWIKSGSYTLGASGVWANGTVTAPIKVAGYTATRGDVCTGASRPSVNFGARNWTTGTDNTFANLDTTGTVNGLFVVSARAQCVNTKAMNTSGSANLRAFNMAADSTLINCEAASTNGAAVSATSNGIFTLVGCYIHDSDIGVTTSNTTAGFFIQNCIIENSTTAAIKVTGATTSASLIAGNTLFGAETPKGVAVDLLAATTGVKMINNIIYGFVTGVTHGTASQTSSYSDYNDFFNNTTNRTNWVTGANDTAVNPAFTSSATHNFALSTNALNYTAFPGVFPGATTTGYLAPGAVQRFNQTYSRGRVVNEGS